MIFLCRSLTDITCKSLLIFVPGIEVLDLIFLAAKKKKSSSQELPLCASACTCESAAQCFLLAFLTGSWCWVQLRTRKRPFLSSVNHLRQREKKIKKKRREGRGGGKELGLLHWFSPLRSFLPLPVFTFCADWLFQLYFLTLCVIFTPATHRCWRDLWVYGEFMSCVRGPGRHRK